MLAGGHRAQQITRGCNQGVLAGFPDSKSVSYVRSISSRMLFLLHKNGTLISQYFFSSSLRAPGAACADRKCACPAKSGPVTLPRMVHGATLTAGLFRIRFTLPEVGFVKI